MLSNALWPPNLLGRTKPCYASPSIGGVVFYPQSFTSYPQSFTFYPQSFTFALKPVTEHNELPCVDNRTRVSSLGRTPDQSVMHCWGRRSCRGQLGSMPYIYNLVGRTPDQSVMHCQGQRSYRCHPGSTRGHIA